MSFDRIVCLANSYKHDHRCVAGISVITKKWVRLVGRQVPGCLTIRETCYADGKQAALLDVFEVQLGESCGNNCHPEDVYVAGEPWRLLYRYDEPKYREQVYGFISKQPSVLQGYTDSISVQKIIEQPRESSLELIQPDDLWWWIREEGDRRRNRAVFRVSKASRVRYDLAVTDPVWLNQLKFLPTGIHPHSLLMGNDRSGTLLSVSLSENFHGFHYKLIAGVVNLPELRALMSKPTKTVEGQSEVPSSTPQTPSGGRWFRRTFRRKT